MNRILLVDDQPPHESHFRRLFGQLDVCRSYDELSQAVSQGARWSAAFIDFDLSGIAEEPQRTGLSALRLLLQEQPETRRGSSRTITTLGGSGWSRIA